jgi:hypothetical protein
MKAKSLVIKNSQWLETAACQCMTSINFKFFFASNHGAFLHETSPLLTDLKEIVLIKKCLNPSYRFKVFFSVGKHQDLSHHQLTDHS